MNIKNILKNVFLFCDLDDASLDLLSKECLVREYKKNKQIFSELEEAKYIYIILRGKVKIYKLSDNGSEHILHIHTDGALIAEASIFDLSFYPAYCTSLTETKVLAISKKTLINLIEKQPKLALKFLAAYSRRLRSFVEKIESLTLTNIKQRVFNHFLENSKNVDGQLVCELKMSKKDLANYIGTRPETVSRVLKTLLDEKLIQKTKQGAYLIKK